MAKILVIAEVKGTEVKKPSLELISKANALGTKVEAVLIGEGIQGQAEVLAQYGASKVYVADDASLKLYQNANYTNLVQQAVEQSGAEQVWLTASELGKDLTPRVAARLDVPAISDASDIEIGDQVLVTRAAMAAKVIQKCAFTGTGTKVISFRAGAFEVGEASSGTAETVSLTVSKEDSRAVVKEIVSESTGAVELTEAEVVLSVGRGVKGPDGIDFVKPLTDLLGAGLGASRAVCDAGWIGHNAQVGQTGKVVTPNLYFAVGLSGAIQHLAGMSGSKVIVAVNKDPDAPIFEVADYGIVGDLFKVVPALMEEVSTLKG